jgi:SnoaL-like domain
VTPQADGTGNAARLRSAIDDWNTGGLRALSDGWWAEDIAWHDLPDLPDPVVTQGRASVEARVEEMIAAVGQWQFVTRGVEERGDLTLAHLELAGHGVQSGAGFTGSIHQIHRWRNGRVIEVLTFGERHQALAALPGLSPAAP